MEGMKLKAAAPAKIVIPAKAGIQSFSNTTGCRIKSGMTAKGF
jgi:hypothetical protein